MTIQHYIFLAVALFSIGIIGVLTRRNVIIIFMCIELMLNAVNLLLVAFSKCITWQQLRQRQLQKQEPTGSCLCSLLWWLPRLK